MKKFIAKAQKQIVKFFVLLTRPFIDFYYNYGLARASVLSYVLCVNLVVFVYLFLAIGGVITLPLQTTSSTRRFLELHFLWPVPEKIQIKEAPVGFGFNIGDITEEDTFNEQLIKYCQKKDIEIADKLQKTAARADEMELELSEYCRRYNVDIHKELEEAALAAKVTPVKFYITEKLGKAIFEATQTFYSTEEERILPLGASFFIILAIAYIAFLLSLKTNLAESVSPLVWGNLPLSNRGSHIMKILWRIPTFNAIQSRLTLFFMLPLMVALAVSVLAAVHALIDNKLWDPYTPLNTSFTALISLVITGLLFTSLYKLNVQGISKKHAAIGAFVAATLWLGGRWLFTTYAAVSLYRNLRNFALIPIFLSWFYYFCSVFLFGLYVAQTLENPNLSMTARSWAMRDLTVMNRYTVLSCWMRLDFLCRLAQSRYEEYPPPFIGIQTGGDTADDIGRQANLQPAFIRECILEMLKRHSEAFRIEVEGNRQYCHLRLPPEEVDIIPLLMDPQDTRDMFLYETESYIFGRFILERFGPCWNAKPIFLSDVYNDYKSFIGKNRSDFYGFMDETDELFL